MSFFDESDEPTRVTRQPRPRRSGGGGGDGGGQRPPREPARRPDRQTVRVRQAVGLGVALLLIIVVVLGVKGCVSSQKENSLKAYNRDVTSVISSSDRDVGQALFRLLGNGSQQGQDLQVQVNQLRLAADEDARRARKFDVPGDMKAAQDKLLLTLDLRAEGAAQDRRRPADGARPRPGRRGTRSPGSPGTCSTSSRRTSSTRRASRR